MVSKDHDLDAFNGRLGPLSATERIAWAIEQFGDDAVLLSSMQKTASVLMHLCFVQGAAIEILFVDTGYHFQETLRLRDEFMRRYQLNIVTLYPAQTPEQQEQQYGGKLYLSLEGQPECCRLRKREPFLAHLRGRGRRLVMSGRRRSEGGKRAGLRILERDPRIDGYELHPLLDWTDQQIDNYVTDHDVPVHPLHEQSYPSIGCACCTTPVQPGEHPRAGRWRHLRRSDGSQPQACHLNFTDGDGI